MKSAARESGVYRRRPASALTLKLPDDANAAHAMLDGVEWRGAMHEVAEALRSWDKYGAVPAEVDPSNPAPGLRAMVYAMLDARGLVLYE